ncbi:hypothetical protein HZH68_004445 [Vespula germanica]|uniref:Uncharacterized protein n=1 Tax=Vespula germanica TaxID=30212 RepID=A0A834KLB3_VESGE|nr:hypothetical protein HZH68_004445 [Vespula germanica]
MCRIEPRGSRRKEKESKGQHRCVVVSEGNVGVEEIKSVSEEGASGGGGGGEGEGEGGGGGGGRGGGGGGEERRFDGGDGLT